MSGSNAYNARLYIATQSKNGQTVPRSVYYSPPYKLTNYFRLSNGGIEYMIMNASAGIMARDNYLVEIELGDKSSLVVSSQSFEKIHKMENASAKRETKIKVGKEAYFKYIPLPTLPFAESSFSNITTINLQDASSKLCYLEILACGRYLRDERFKYKLYKSLVDIYQMDKLVFKDNSVFEPGITNLECFGMFEGYTHLANLIAFGFEVLDDINLTIIKLFELHGVDGGVTTLLNGGYLIRALANESEVLIKCFREVILLFEKPSIKV